MGIRNTTSKIISQLRNFLTKPNSGIIKIILRDGSTVIGLYHSLEQNRNEDGNIVLTNGRKVPYTDIDQIV